MRITSLDVIQAPPLYPAQPSEPHLRDDGRGRNACIVISIGPFVMRDRRRRVCPIYRTIIDHYQLLAQLTCRMSQHTRSSVLHSLHWASTGTASSPAPCARRQPERCSDTPPGLEDEEVLFHLEHVGEPVSGPFGFVRVP